MSPKSESKKAKKAAAATAKQRATIDISQRESQAVVAWALKQRSEESKRFIDEAERGITVRLFGRISASRSAEVKINVSRDQANVLLSLETSTEELHELVEGTLPFVEYPIVMLSTNSN
jgi:hypothetical protein